MAVKTVKFKLASGEFVDLTYEAASGSWKGTALSPITTSWNEEDHKYGGVIEATDDAGNVTTVDSSDPKLGESLKLRVIEKVAPTITVISPAQDAQILDARPEFTFKVFDDGSGVNTSTISVLVDGKAISGVPRITPDTTLSGRYNVSIELDSDLADGDHTYTISVSDNDGNEKVSSNITFHVDTVDPELNVTAPADNTFTNVKTITVEGTASDVTSRPVTVTVNGQAVSVVEGNFSTTVALNEGENVITIVATDASGRTTTITRTVIVDTKAPVIESVLLSPNPVDAGATYLVTVIVKDD